MNQTDGKEANLLELLNKNICEKIKIAGSSMGISCVAMTNNTVTLRLPFKENSNDKGTMFAGSIYSVCVLSGWCLSMALAYKNGFKNPWAAVIDSSCSYKKAIKNDIEATAKPDSAEIFTEPIAGERNFIKIQVKIENSVVFKATYAVGINSGGDKKGEKDEMDKI